MLPKTTDPAVRTSRRVPLALPVPDACALLLAAAFPSLTAWWYFIAMGGRPAAIQQTAYAAGKIFQFGFPLFWVLVIQRRRPRWKRPAAAGLIEALGFGLAVAAAMLLGYFLWLRSAGLLTPAAAAIAGKVAGFGVNSPARFVALGVFYCLFHSLLEEYYWRWFVFGGLGRFMPLGPAIVVSSVAFAAHHVIILAAYFGLFSAATVLCSLGVAIGGAAWAWIYHRSDSLLGPWLSHLLVDAAIFVVGYDLVRGALGG